MIKAQGADVHVTEYALDRTSSSQIALIKKNAENVVQPNHIHELCSVPYSLYIARNFQKLSSTILLFVTVHTKMDSARGKKKNEAFIYG